MPADPIAFALRRDAEALLDLAPRPDAAAAWHAVRMARAHKLERMLRRSGWALRGAVAAIAAAVAILAPDALAGAGVPLVLVVWLTSAMCSPVGSNPAVNPRRLPAV